MEEVGGVGKALRNAAVKHKDSLIITDKEGYSRLKSVSKNFGETFDGGVLEGDGSKIPSLTSVVLLREEDKVGAVDTFKVRVMSVESVEEFSQTLGSDGPSSFEEGWTKPIRA